MTDQTFKPGDVVFHKANNLRMVVVEMNGSSILTEFVNANGEFVQDSFMPIVLSTFPTASDYENIRVINQLESKASPK